MAPSLETAVGPLALERPAMLASGILGISLDVFRRIHEAGAGAVVTKSLSTEPRKGYHNPSVIGIKGGGWINAVGLSNPGARAFAGMIRPNRDIPVVVSLVGSEPGEFEGMVREFDGCRVDAYELNLSCPHVERVGLEVGDDPGLVSEIVAATKKASGAPVIAKVGLGKTDYMETVEAAIHSGADAITAINTIRSIAIDVHAQRPILSNGYGGLSGTPIKQIALRCVYEISSRHDVPIIGCGGISSWEDAAEFVLAGASAVQIGSAVGSDWMGVFGEINDGMLNYMEGKGMDTIREMVGLAKRS